MRSDLAYAWRAMLRAPAMSAMVIVTLTIGIGANGAMFTFLDRLFLRPPAGIDEPDALRRVWIGGANSRGERSYQQALSYPEYEAIQSAVGGLADVALYNMYDALTLGRDVGGPPVHGAYATANYFTLLGVRLAAGRFFTDAEAEMGKGAPVAVISYAFWKSRLAGDSTVIGRTIRVGTQQFSVIGIADRAFAGVDVQSVDVWMPLASDPYSLPKVAGWGDKTWWQTANSPGRLRVILRLRDRASDGELLARTAVGLERATQRWTRGRDIRLGSIIESRGPQRLNTGTRIGTRLGGVAAIVLVIAVANVINLLLARATHRRREIAVRLALGISRARLVRLLTAETSLLALLSAGAALLVAWWGGEVLRRLLLPSIEWTDSATHWRVAAFTIGVALVAGAIAGVIPALQASRPKLSQALHSGTPQSGARSRGPAYLVATQAALSVVLLVGAALFVRSLQNVQNLDIGYEFDGVVHGTLQFRLGESPGDATLRVAIAEVAQRLRGMPGVAAVATTWNRPLSNNALVKYFAGSDSVFRFREDGSVPPLATVSPAFFETVGLRMLRGTTFSAQNAREVVVNEAMARHAFPGRDALGQCIRFESLSNPCNTVVGIVENARRSSILEDAAPQFYAPFGMFAGMALVENGVLVRATPGTARSVMVMLRGMLREAFPADHPVIIEMTDVLATQQRPWRLGATLFTTFGVLALVVAIVGVFSSVSYGVSRRTREFGVRMALGARMADLIRLVVGEGLVVVAVGVVAGVGLSLAAGRFIASLLYDVQPNDPTSILAVCVALLAAAGLAALIPAWRASRVDPVVALRTE